jgi:hypothetical protein
MNSSIAAAIIAPRRSAARSARLEVGFGREFDAADVLTAGRRLAGFAADFRALLVASFVMFRL